MRKCAEKFDISKKSQQRFINNGALDLKGAGRFHLFSHLRKKNRFLNMLSGSKKLVVVLHLNSLEYWFKKFFWASRRPILTGWLGLKITISFHILTGWGDLLRGIILVWGEAWRFPKVDKFSLQKIFPCGRMTLKHISSLTQSLQNVSKILPDSSIRMKLVLSWAPQTAESWPKKVPKWFAMSLLVAGSISLCLSPAMQLVGWFPPCDLQGSEEHGSHTPPKSSWGWFIWEMELSGHCLWMFWKILTPMLSRRRSRIQLCW